MALEPTDLNKLQRLAQAVANGAQAMMDAAESILRYEHPLRPPCSDFPRPGLFLSSR